MPCGLPCLVELLVVSHLGISWQRFQFAKYVVFQPDLSLGLQQQRFQYLLCSLVAWRVRFGVDRLHF